MPPLKIGNFRLFIAEDDSHIISVGSIVLRIIQIGFLIPCIILLSNSKSILSSSSISSDHWNSTNNATTIQATTTTTTVVSNATDSYYNNNEYYNDKRKEYLLFYTFWGLSFGSAIVTIGIELAIFRISRKGNIIDDKKERILLPSLWIIKLVPLTIVRIVCFTVGVMVILLVQNTCYNNNGDDNNNDNEFNNNGTTTTSVVQYYNCSIYYEAVQWIKVLAWIHIIDLIAIILLYIHVSCIVVSNVRRHVLQKLFVKRTVQATVTYRHWSLLCRCACTVTSLCTCCLLGGRHAIFHGDFTDVAMSLTDLINTGATSNHNNNTTNHQNSIRQSDNNKNYNNKNVDNTTETSNKNHNDNAVGDPNNNSSNNQQREVTEGITAEQKDPTITTSNNNTTNQLHTAVTTLTNILQLENQPRPIVEITTSDIMAGLLLVAEEQRIQRWQKGHLVHQTIQRQRSSDMSLLSTFQSDSSNISTNSNNNTNNNPSSTNPKQQQQNPQKYFQQQQQQQVYQQSTILEDIDEEGQFVITGTNSNSSQSNQQQQQQQSKRKTSSKKKTPRRYVQSLKLCHHSYGDIINDNDDTNDIESTGTGPTNKDDTMNQYQSNIGSQEKQQKQFVSPHNLDNVLADNEEEEEDVVLFMNDSDENNNGNKKPTTTIHPGTDNKNDSNMSVPIQFQHSSTFYYDVTERFVLEVDDATLLRDAARYMKLSLAVYGSLMYLYRGKYQCFCFPCLRLLSDGSNYNIHKQCPCCDNPKKQIDHDEASYVYDEDIVVDGSDCCNFNEFACFDMGGDDVTLAYANFQNSLHFCPYSITVDHVTKAIVIAIQGTLSLEAAVTDITLFPANVVETLERIASSPEGTTFTAYNDATTTYSSITNGYCHAGILKCAINLHKDLERHKKLYKLLFDNHAQFHSYKLVITGHSLGGGVAAMLAILLEPLILRHGIDLQSVCFSPPGTTLTKDLAEKEYITSIVLDSDIVPRLSLQAFEVLRNDVLEMIARAKVPKHEIFYQLLFHSRRYETYHHTDDDADPNDDDNNNDNDDDEDDVIVDQVSGECPFFYERNMIPDTPYMRNLRKYMKFQRKVKAEREQRIGDAKLIIPGKRIIHIIKDRVIDAEESSGNLGDAMFNYPIRIRRRSSERRQKRRRPRTYTAIWAKADDFAEIQVCKSFLSDHIPTNVLQQLEILADEYTHRATQHQQSTTLQQQP